MLNKSKQVNFYFSIAAWASVLAVVAGVFFTMQTGSGLSAFKLQGYMPQVTTLALIRELIPDSTCLSVLFALIAWGHRLNVSMIRSSLWGMLFRGLLAALAIFPFVLTLAVIASFVTGYAAYGIKWREFYNGFLNMIELMDLIFGLRSLGLNMIIVGVFSWIILPLMTRWQQPLAAKIIEVWVVLFLVRTLLRVLL